MKKKLTVVFLAVLVSILFVSQVFGSIHGLFSGYPIVRIIADGREIRGDVPGVILEGRTMVPVRFISEALGAVVEWEGDTYTVNIKTDIAANGLERKKTVAGAVNPYGPSIDLAALGVPIGLIDAFKLEKKGEQKAVPLIFSLVDNKVFIGSTGDTKIQEHGWRTVFIGFAGGSNILELYQEYILKVFTTSGQLYQISFKTGGLPALANNSASRQIVLIPAMPEKGFYWPYLLAIPNIDNKAVNIGHRRYLLVDINNTGSTNNYDETLSSTKEFISNRGFVAVQTANALWSPMMVPVFPRPLVDYNNYYGEYNWFLTHSLDRDTALLHLNMQKPSLRQTLIERFAEASFNVHHLERLDLQLIAMFDHAIEYLNQQEFNLEPTKVFLYGYSASGTFTDRFATFHPERVKAISSGATLDDMILPLAQYQGKQLVFPIGIYDFELITGREFCLERHNQVARLIHMGEEDTANTLPYNDCYGDREREIITELWGVDVLPRAKQLIELYGKSGGKGIFILDRGQGHWESQEMKDYIIEFFKANRGTDTPVYILPSNPAQLKYRLFE